MRVVLLGASLLACPPWVAWPALSVHGSCMYLADPWNPCWMIPKLLVATHRLQWSCNCVQNYKCDLEPRLKAWQWVCQGAICTSSEGEWCVRLHLPPSLRSLCHCHLWSDLVEEDRGLYEATPWGGSKYVCVYSVAEVFAYLRNRSFWLAPSGLVWVLLVQFPISFQPSLPKPKMHMEQWRASLRI